MVGDLKKLMIEEFSSYPTQFLYIKKAEEGLWPSENYFFRKYFSNTSGKLLDVGCGTGRTSIPLQKLGFRVVGVDIAKPMIINAKKIARSKNIKLQYFVADVENLLFVSEQFDYAIFSNQGWTQMPGKQSRLNALKEVHRVLKKGGIFIFTTHNRVFELRMFLFWVKQWIRFYILKPLGFSVLEQDYGDRFFERVVLDGAVKYRSTQYVHIPTSREVLLAIQNSGFEVIEFGNGGVSRSGDYNHSPTFFVCKKL